MSAGEEAKLARFLVAGLLGAAICGWVLAGELFDFGLEKEAVALQRPLAELPLAFGSYRYVEEVALHPSVVRKLGANEQITRVYANEAVAQGQPGAALRLHLAYYTGHEPTLRVKHVPEICYVNFGFKGKDTHRGSVSLGPREMPLSVFRFRPEDGQEDFGVAYGFVANGELCGSPEAVAQICQTGGGKSAYFLKVELLPGTLTAAGDDGGRFRPTPASQREILQASQQFLSALLPELESLLPELTE